MSGQFRLDSRNLCDRVLGWTGIGGIKKESSFSHYTGWGKRTKAAWSTTRSHLSLAEILSLYQSKKGRIVPSVSSLNRVHLGWWKLGPRVKEDLSYGVPSKQAQDMGSTYDRRSGNFLLFLIEYQTYHTAIWPKIRSPTKLPLATLKQNISHLIKRA